MEGKIQELPPGTSVILGRSSSAQICIDDGKLSRHHCRIYSQGDRWFIEDLGSKNGTFLNQRALHQSPLSHGDEIRLGGTSLYISLRQGGENPCLLCNRTVKNPLSFHGKVLCEECLFGAGPFQGRYSFKEKIGEGGMGAVFLCKDIKNSREVAIKLILDEEALAKKKFLREVRTMEVLSHPNIVPLYEVGEMDKLLYLVMEYLQGVSLIELIKQRGSLPIAYSIHLAAQIALALGHAHQKKVVHRDVNPHNILISEKGVAKLSDFGIAKILDHSSATALTDSGEGKGTLDYIAPEQMTNAAHVDFRSDLYSLGATLYHMLTGRKPFEAIHTRDLIMKILKEPPVPPSQIRLELPRAVDRILLKCLEKDPKNRPASRDELYKQLYFLHGKLG